MSTPAYGIKHWWRAERREGESLKAFARRFLHRQRPGSTEIKGTANIWLARKAAQKRRHRV